MHLYNVTCLITVYEFKWFNKVTLLLYVFHKIYDEIIKYKELRISVDKTNV